MLKRYLLTKINSVTFLPISAFEVNTIEEVKTHMESVQPYGTRYIFSVIYVWE